MEENTFSLREKLERKQIQDLFCEDNEAFLYLFQRMPGEFLSDMFNRFYRAHQEIMRTQRFYPQDFPAWTFAFENDIHAICVRFPFEREDAQKYVRFIALIWCGEKEKLNLYTINSTKRGENGQPYQPKKGAMIPVNGGEFGDPRIVIRNVLQMYQKKIGLGETLSKLVEETAPSGWTIDGCRKESR